MVWHNDVGPATRDGAPVALVTGANRGLGRETARQLAERGARVLLGSRDADRGAEVAAELAAAGVSVRPVRLDVTDPATVRAAAAEIDEIHGRLDILVNNAGISIAAPAAETDGALLRRVVDVNVVGAADVICVFLPLLRRSAAPRIVNLSSTAASLTLTREHPDFGPEPDTRLAYTTSKAALNMLTVQYANAFRREPGLRHIKINSVSPGYVATDLTRHRGTRTVAEGAGVVVRLATLPADGPSGGFFDDKGSLPW
ncbi:SDR family oxidoreductase [Nocardia terpenica]|uniref:SDR family oxidoreductase n=1 Tax=Nocardia terpenica TaxID=455432 RepID=UPI002FE14A99